MPEEIVVELSPVSSKKPFYKTGWGVAVLAAIVLVIIAALFSWWLASGKISSVAARLDTMIYTVGSDFPARVKTIYVAAGDQVAKDQPLALVESPEFAGQLQSAAEELAKLRSLAGLPQSGVEKDSPTLVEKEAASKLAQARFEEDRLQKIYQDAVTEHVKALLAKRSIPFSRQAEYGQAELNESRAAMKVTEALENFEKASKFRAALDQALTKIRLAIMAARRSSGLTSTEPGQQGVGRASFAGEEKLSSPAEGSVFRVTASPGQILQPGEAAFYILPGQGQENGERWIQAWFSPGNKKSIEAGQPVNIRFPDMGLIISGKVEVVGENEESLPDALLPEGHTAALTRPSSAYLQGLYLPVKISIDKPGEVSELEPGARAECQIQTHYIFKGGLF